MAGSVDFVVFEMYHDMPHVVPVESFQQRIWKRLLVVTYPTGSGSIARSGPYIVRSSRVSLCSLLPSATVIAIPV